MCSITHKLLHCITWLFCPHIYICPVSRIQMFGFSLPKPHILACCLMSSETLLACFKACKTEKWEGTNGQNLICSSLGWPFCPSHFSGSTVVNKNHRKSRRQYINKNRREKLRQTCVYPALIQASSIQSQFRSTSWSLCISCQWFQDRY